MILKKTPNILNLKGNKLNFGVKIDVISFK